mgnify:CR=1 FL=1
MKHGKHYVDAAKQVDFSKLYDMNEALELACKTASAKFDETVELHVRLGVDGRHADQQVRGAVVLPNGTGKNVRVIAIAKGDAAKAAEAAGAQEVGDDELIKIHYHTNEPWQVLEYCASLGEIYDIVVEDMDRQARNLHG